jgi:ATP-dependent DNA helicase RecG
MRPELLNPYFSSLTSLPGIGPKLRQLVTKLLLGTSAGGEARIVDLLFHLPSGVIDRRDRPGIAHARAGAIATLDLHVDRHQPAPRNSRAPYKVWCHDDTGEIELVFFHAQSDWLQKTLPIGDRRFISGTVEWFNDRPQMVHPDHILDAEAFASMPLLEPVYPLTAGLSPKTLARAIGAALDLVPTLPEWQDREWLRRNTLPEFCNALAELHRPSSTNALQPDSAAHRRLAFDEFLASQLALALMRQHMRRARGPSWRGSGELENRVLAQLPFSLTSSQRRATDEIVTDLEAPRRMLRLLQGDVGSGKTIVALLAMLRVVEGGGQAAIMAPTEILARQHFATISELTRSTQVSVAILTGREKGKVRKSGLAALADGSIDLLVGTHALFQAGIDFHNLGLAVVDEQHRFGVHQRLALAGKGVATDVLVMTATPIPRTLVLTYFGDMDVSQLTEKPAGRHPIKTTKASTERMDQVVDRLASALAEGGKAYWVCPLVEESELVDIAAAQDRHAVLKARFGDKVGLIHGRMKGVEKDAAMSAFQSGAVRILVATTVIEVGVDIPDATIMIIEHAERFGLAQLHQLRGRVGRGERPSSCLLLYRGPLGAAAQARLAIMCDTQDGFRIAEEDLKLRGEGEILGTRQSGMPGFRLARIEHHSDLLQAARDDARLVLETDPHLTGTRGQALRSLLYLFGRDDAVRLLQAG